MNKIDCIYYDEEFNCCGFETDYGQPMPVFKTCYENICTRKKQKPLLETPTTNGKYIKLGEPKVNYDEITCSYKMINKVHTQICNMVDKNIIDNVIAYAKENDVADLILIDEQFVRNALKHEEQRQKTKRTNYDKITESVESLAEWIYSQYGGSPADMPCKETSCENPNCKECFKEWLQKECDNG